jgi:hypothetical protein
MRSVLRIVISSIAGVLCATTVVAVAADIKDARIGTWSHCVDVPKSDSDPAPPNVTIMFEAAGKGSHTIVNGVDDAGSPYTVEYTAMYDGKDYPIKGAPWADTVSLKLIDSRTTIRTDKKDGKVVVTLKGVVSKDGKTFTITRKATGSNGEPVTATSVCERQS